MIEAMKQWLEALEDFVDVIKYDNEQDDIGRRACCDVAWMHIMDNTEGIKANGAGIVSITQKHKHPFGKAGIDFSKSYPVTSTPLYTHPPQHTWIGLTIDEREQIQQECFGKVPHHVAFAHAVEAKLKEKNHG
jgi:hypothetical protein